MSDRHEIDRSDSQSVAATRGPARSLWRRLQTTPLLDVLRGRLSGRLDVANLLTVSELPEAACGRIRAIVQRTRLWRIEKAEVAAELIAHFSDGLEAGASLDELLASFGDVRTTAKLIRRAKVRCRPVLWHGMRWLVHGLAILLVAYVAAAIYFALDKPTVSVNYVAQVSQDGAAVPQNQRAWPIYREALLTIDDRWRARDVLEMYALEPGGESWPHAVELLHNSERALLLARHGAAKPHLGYVIRVGVSEEDRELWPVDYSAQLRRAAERESSDFDEWKASQASMLRIVLGYIDELRLLVGLLVIDAKHVIHTRQPGDGHGDRVVADIIALLGIAGQLNEGGFVWEFFEAWRTFWRATDLTDDILRHHHEMFSDDHLRDLAHAFAAEGLAPVMSLRFERARFYDIVQRMYTDDGHGDGRLTPDGLRLLAELIHDHEDWVIGENALRAAEFAALPLASATIASRKEMLARYDALMDHVEALSAKPHWEARHEDSTFALLAKMSDREKAKYALIPEVLSFVTQARLTQQFMAGQRDGILVALALELHRRREGWPKTLDELSPDLLPSVPCDRFTGRPLRYRVVGDEAVVYSLGRDLDDDGGVVPNLGEKFLTDDESPEDRYSRFNEGASVRWDYPSNPPSDGDWILWRSAGWPSERGDAHRRTQHNEQ